MGTVGSKGIGSLFGKLGPGLLLAATAIGASHLVMSPQAGSLFGYQLLWLVTLTHLFKYHAFEFGPRYAAATGESLIAGYMRVPGPKGWALWILMGGTVAQGIGVLAGVVSIAAAVLTTFVGRMSLEFYTALVIVTVLGFLFLGGYGWLDFLNKIMMTVLFLATLAVFVPAVPPPAAFTNFVIPSIPEGSIPLIAAILGWMPTGIDVSIWHSLWTLEKHPELVSKGAQGARKLEILRLSLTDMRIGYALSFVVAAVFLILAALFLQGTEQKIADEEFAKSLAAIYTNRIGPWMYVVFMVAAFSAMYSTTYTVMDGFSRSFAETVATLRPDLRAKWWKRLYWGFVLTTAIFAFVVVVKSGNPVKLVTVVALLSLCVAPLYYGLNYYCVTRFITEDKFRARIPARVVALLGIVVMFLATLLYAASKLNFIK
ncbi:MAG: Nramp family divalent metal transporter [Planctomycetota bacterium]|jgi:Mn2+/Fe2+ NRAMP family transporter